MDDAKSLKTLPNPSSTDPSSRRLELSPIMWVAIALLGLIGAREAMVRSNSVSVLNCLHDGHRIPIRRTDTVQDFEQLGVRVNLPNGWSLLATTPNDRATRPTFVNEGEGCVVKLFSIQGVDPIEQLTRSGETAHFDKHDNGARVAWIAVRQTMRIEAPNGNGGKLPLSWEMPSSRRVGRWTHGDVKIGLLVATNKTEAKMPTAIDEFCAGLSRRMPLSEKDFPPSATLHGNTND